MEGGNQCPFLSQQRDHLSPVLTKFIKFYQSFLWFFFRIEELSWSEFFTAESVGQIYKGLPDDLPRSQCRKEDSLRTSCSLELGFMTISLATLFQWLNTLSVKHLFLIWFSSELPLREVHSISSCPVTGHQREEISTFPSTALLEEVEDWDEVFPQPFLLQAPTDQVTLAASPCLSPSWSTCSECSLTVSCPSYIKDNNINVKSLEQFV